MDNDKIDEIYRRIEYAKSCHMDFTQSYEYVLQPFIEALEEIYELLGSTDGE